MALAAAVGEAVHPIGGIGSPQTIYSVGTSASWEIDLFGRIGRRVEAADARIGIAREDRNGLLLTIIADTVQNYAELRIAQEQIDAVEANLATARETVRLTQLRLDKGLASQFDLSRAEGDARTAQAQLAPLQAQIRANNAAIAALTGQFPAELGESLTHLPDRGPARWFPGRDAERCAAPQTRYSPRRTQAGCGNRRHWRRDCRPLPEL